LGRSTTLQGKGTTLVSDLEGKRPGAGIQRGTDLGVGEYRGGKPGEALGLSEKSWGSGEDPVRLKLTKSGRLVKVGLRDHGQ